MLQVVPPRVTSFEALFEVPQENLERHIDAMEAQIALTPAEERQRQRLWREYDRRVIVRQQGLTNAFGVAILFFSAFAFCAAVYSLGAGLNNPLKLITVGFVFLFTFLAFRAVVLNAVDWVREDLHPNRKPKP